MSSKSESNRDRNMGKLIISMKNENISTEVDGGDSQDDGEITWKIISALFIVLTSILIIVSLILWYSLPSSTKNLQKTLENACELPRNSYPTNRI